MHDSGEFPPAPRAYRPWALVVLAAVGLGALSVLVLAGAADAGPSLAAGLALAAALGLVLLLAGRPAEAPFVAQAAPSQPASSHDTVGLLEQLPEPVMLVAGEAGQDSASARILFANAAARDLFFIRGEGGRLVAALRSPAALESIDEALVGGIDSEAEIETTGVQERVWRLAARSLAAGSAAGGRSVLVWMRDETDARRAERTRADFLANASHELRTPLASLIGFIETLRGPAREDAAARERFLEIMAVQADRMARLIEDLMSLSRIELNEHIAPQDRVDLSLAVVDVADALAPMAAAKGVEIKAETPPRGHAIVMADRDQILQVVQNLADNALKYAGQGGRVTIRVGEEDSATPADPGLARFDLLLPDHATSRRYVSLRIADTGPGIAREHLPRLTQRFYRVEGQKSGERLGTGLGLAIVKHIVNRHRGGLAVESREGDGAAFTVRLPAAETEA